MTLINRKAMNIFDYLFEKTKKTKALMILGPSESASYQDVYNTSLNLAHYLRQNIGSKKKILIVSSNSLFFIIAYLAILKSGNICVPINPDIEKETIKYIMSKCKSSNVFVSKKNIGKFDGLNCNIISNVIQQETSTKIEDIQFESDCDDNSIAEIIFTSGSTGKPKGVMLSHKNIICNTNSIISYLKLTERDIVQVVLPFYYCYGLSLLHTHIRVGGALVLNNSFMFLGKIIDDLKKYKCTGFAGVPSHFQILLRQSKDFKNTEFPHLKYVTQAGGKLHNSFISEFTDAFPDIKFFVMYGQTEATARLSYLAPEYLHSKLGSIGMGIPGVKLKVVDSEGSTINNGKVGEIIAKGDNIMIGYLGDKKATNEVIRDGWLFTGDLGKIDKDGFIFITGRKKGIIKIRGNRISSNEIEEIIMQIPEIINCSVSETVDDIIGETIKAEIITNGRNNKISEESIKAYCSQKLTAFKVPRVIEIKTEYKLNGSGKKCQ